MPFPLLAAIPAAAAAAGTAATVAGGAAAVGGAVTAGATAATVAAPVIASEVVAGGALAAEGAVAETAIAATPTIAAEAAPAAASEGISSLFSGQITQMQEAISSMINSSDPLATASEQIGMNTKEANQQMTQMLQSNAASQRRAGSITKNPRGAGDTGQPGEKKGKAFAAKNIALNLKRRQSGLSLGGL